MLLKKFLPLYNDIWFLRAFLQLITRTSDYSNKERFHKYKFKNFKKLDYWYNEQFYSLRAAVFCFNNFNKVLVGSYMFLVFSLLSNTVFKRNITLYLSLNSQIPFLYIDFLSSVSKIYFLLKFTQRLMAGYWILHESDNLHGAILQINKGSLDSIYHMRVWTANFLHVESIIHRDLSRNILCYWCN